MNPAKSRHVYVYSEEDATPLYFGSLDKAKRHVWKTYPAKRGHTILWGEQGDTVEATVYDSPGMWVSDVTITKEPIR